jgi:hypothetical protein
MRYSTTVSYEGKDVTINVTNFALSDKYSLPLPAPPPSYFAERLGIYVIIQSARAAINKIMT